MGAADLTRLCLLLTCAFHAVAQDRYDLLVKGAHVIDPKNGISAVRDVAIRDGRIARVDSGIPPAQARQVVDASGLYLTPGLVDIHVHAFAATMAPEYTGESCVRPDAF